MADLVHDIKTPFPNELGRVLVSVKDMTIVPLETREERIGDIMAKERKSKKPEKELESKESGQNIDKIDKKAIDDIWRHLGLGHIDISYACVGYSMDGRPILNHEDLVNLLINYGFMVKDILPFIDDFAASGAQDSKSPIVMYTSNTSAIMTDIEPLT